MGGAGAAVRFSLLHNIIDLPTDPPSARLIRSSKRSAVIGRDEFAFGGGLTRRRRLRGSIKRLSPWTAHAPLAGLRRFEKKNERGRRYSFYDGSRSRKGLIGRLVRPPPIPAGLHRQSACHGKKNAALRSMRPGIPSTSVADRSLR